MRLNSVKMSGFKSFVDPTTFSFPASMVSIVGPNGCGKSNIIDAVRWVMGESSRHLRGNTVEDVIFNGSSARSPSGQALVELVFDNSEGKFGGKYSAYSEISVRRQAMRDGQSKYFLNGTRCRRKDIVALFLGTGLGPNSYAIIEQGMISRLIDTKPDELRVYLEEAAGISRYKERRRETENHIRHTCENLERLNDVVEEITKRIEHLQRQARAAEHYKVLKDKERQARMELLALRWQAQQGNVETLRQSVERKQTEIEKTVADMRAIEAEIEKLRQQHAEETESFNEVQGEYYRLGAEISRVEQSIQHAKELSGHYGEELKQIQGARAQAEQAFGDERAQAQELEARINEIEPQLDAARRALDSNTEKLGGAESKMAVWQEAWEALTEKIAGPAQTVEIEASRTRYLETHLEQLKARKARLAESLYQCTQRSQSGEAEDLEAHASKTGATLQALSSRLDQVTAKISQGRDTSQKLGVEVQQAREKLQDMQVRLASLQALQKVVLGEEGQAVGNWLEQQGLNQAPRLMDTIKTEPGWEGAVETVLGDYLESVCVQDIEQAAVSCSQIETGRLIMLGQNSSVQTIRAHGTLASKVQAPVDLTELLGNIHIAADIHLALERRKTLESGQSVITREGIWMGSNWLRIARTATNQGNVLQRKREIRRLEKAVTSQGRRVDALVSDLDASQHELGEDEHDRDDVQARFADAQKQHVQAKANMASWEQEQEHLVRQEEQLRDYSEEVDRQVRQAQEELGESAASKQQAETVLEGFGGERDALLCQRDDVVFHLDNVRSEEAESRESIHALTLELESCRSSLHAAQASLDRMQEQTAQLQQRNESLQTSVKENDAPLEELDSQLKELVGQRIEIKQSLAEARIVTEETEGLIRARRETVVTMQGQQERLQDELSDARLAWQEAKVRSTTVEEQLDEYEASPESLIQQLPEDAALPEWEEKVQVLGRKITRLGPINLAAISEFEEHSERKEYLDSQHEDLSKALEILEQAIRKIDQETKDRFKDIFDRVNQRLQDMYPRLFGGGKAFLEMTGDDLLTTGISIMARLPGKRLSSIHLMSGGEKALTAVALVFSLFELNPAPFCLLDEVDAPLDDANVTRYCELLKDMSDRVQFICITHNKNTMEYASQLLGITMSEPGVSRMVSVDVDEAVELHAVS